jgi:hypothetical protein
MLVDYFFNFADQQAIAGGAGVDVLSTNVYDAGSAKKVFEGHGDPDLKIDVTVTAAAGPTPNFRARLVGADNAALTTNPITIADTGVISGIVAGDLPIHRELVPQGQRTAKRYYGVIFVQSGADHTATVNAQGVANAQSNQLI